LALLKIDLDAMLANLALEEGLPQIVDSIRLDPRNVVGNCLTEFSADIPSSGIFRVVGGDLVLCLRLIEKSSEY
jgi:hypothetical protein